MSTATPCTDLAQFHPPSGLLLLRNPFLPNQISKLPKPTKAQTDAVKANFKIGIRCVLCNGWHHPDVIHLDYVGHAALTDRLLDADPKWNWEPLAMDEHGLPLLDRDGGMWIKLTVCGITRLGYGDAQNKIGPDATKELIGDALRNAAMRFGAALDLWHKGELHQEPPDVATENPPNPDTKPATGEQMKHIAQFEDAEKIPEDKLKWLNARRENLTTGDAKRLLVYLRKREKSHAA